MTTAIQVIGKVPTVSLVPAATKIQKDIVQRLDNVLSVSNDNDAELASAVLRDAKALTTEVETTRKVLKRPIIDLGRKIESTAEDFLRPIESGIDRVKRLLSAFLDEKDRAAREAERKRAEEAAKIEAERERKIREEEAKLQARLASLKTEAAKERAQQAAQSKFADIGQAAAEQYDSLAPAIVPVKAEGVALRRPWKFEVLDLDALAKARPDLVEITPRTREINAALSAGVRAIPGLRIWQEAEVRVKA